MRNPVSLFGFLLPLTGTAAATALGLNTTILQPWEITRLSTHSPSGYPANHPYMRISFGIRDPNTIVLGDTPFGDADFVPSAVNCTVWWLGYAAAGPNPVEGGWVNTCDEMDSRQGKWTFVVLDGTESTGRITTDFGLRITLEEAVTLKTGGVARLRFEGQAALRVGDNMAGACGGSGVCNWGLNNPPLIVKQKLVGLDCVAGKCELA
ncbi:hypothetical protein VTH82DRAFT_463 [Thermothelomyces myriococcoides]